MELNAFFPPEVLIWLTRYGLFGVIAAVVLLGLALVMRPFLLWFSGRAEILERLKRLETDHRKSLLELEILNQTLSIPLKKAAAKPAPPPPEEPLVVSQETKETFLRALARSRKPSE